MSTVNKKSKKKNILMEETNKARIVYFEPNELFGGDNQPVSQEDLTKYVNLSVRIPSRFYNESTLRRNYDSVLKGTAFIEKDENNVEYTKLYLTDNYVNVSYTEFDKNGEINNGELFGIQSINISFDTQFFPVVTIVFTDVKGFGLMSTMEYNYENDKLKNLTAKSFFTSLFNFPYPLFTLEVKGYYGKSISFDLSVKDFNTSFDSNTGNFNTTVSFIGHLYGVYGDIPMSYLLISPYIDINHTTNGQSETHNTGETWKQLGENNLLSYLELLEKYIQLLKGEGVDTGNGSFLRTLELKRIELSKLLEIKELYENIIEFSKTQLSNMTTTDGCFYPKRANEKSLFESSYYIGDNSIAYYLEGTHLCIFHESGSTLEDACVYYMKLKDNIANLTYDSKYDLAISNLNFSQEECQTKYACVKFTNIFTKYNNINNEIEQINKFINDNSEIEQEDVIELVTKKLGFAPTIKNIYKILFKHLDCFGKHFFNTVKNIDQNRKVNTANVYDLEKIGDIVPPFPAAYKRGENRSEIIYPGDITAFSTSPEVNLVEKIYNSIFYASKNLDQAEHTILLEEEVQSSLGKAGFGSLFEDYKTPGRGNYFVLLNTNLKPKDNSSMAAAIRDIFLARLNTFIKIHYKSSSKEYNEKFFNEVESTLLHTSNPYLDVEVVNTLERYSDKKTDLYNRFNALSGGSNWGFVTFPPGSDLTSSNTDNYKVIHSNNKIDSSVIIFKQGSHDECETYTKDSFPKNYYVLFHGSYEITGDNSNWHVNKYQRTDLCTKNEFEYRGGYNGGETSVTWEGCTEETTVHYLDGNSVFTAPEYSTEEEHPFFRWFGDSFGYKTLSIKRTYDHSYYDRNFITDNGYETATSKRETLNKVACISLAQLLGIGEALLYGSDDAYFIPVSWYPEGSLDEGEYFYLGYRKYFKCTSIFKDLTIGLYKTFFNINPSDKEKEYYNYFKIPETIKTLKDACEYWYVIGKNFEYVNENSTINQTKLIEIFSDFVKKIKEKYGYVSITNAAITKDTKEKKTTKETLKLNIYYTLKNLYDKWFSGLPSNYFDLNKNDSEFGRIHFLTTTFNDISDSLMVSIDSFVKQIMNIKRDDVEGNKTVLSYMSSLAQNNLSSFLVLPTKIFNENLQEAFKPYNFYDGSLNHDTYGSTYIVMYNSDVSYKLNIEGSETFDDGYMIADYINGEMTVSDEAARIMNVTNAHNYSLQAFGVTYGMQNQNFFKNIKIDTTTPQMSDYAIANMLNIADQADNFVEVVNNHIKPQSLYPVYANRSYNCTVEMMGCMNILPLTYFQLNNIPMFKGAYIIINVEHNITPNDFITTFTGVRVSKYNIPLNKEVLNLDRVGTILAASERNNNNNDNNVSSNDVNFSAHSEDATYEVPDIGKINFITLTKTENEWTPYNNRCGKDCMASAKLSAKKILSGDENIACTAYTSYGSSAYVVQLLYEKLGSAGYYDNKDYNLYYEESGGYNREHKYTCCVEYMKKELSDKDNPAPVIVGVAHSLKRWNDDANKWLNEGVTDHFLCVYAYGETGDGKVYFKYFESGRKERPDCVNDRNILTYDPNNGNPKFYCLNSTRNKDKEKYRRYDVSQVRIYDEHRNRFSNQALIGPQKDFNDFTGNNVYLSLSNEYMYANQK